MKNELLKNDRGVSFFFFQEAVISLFISFRNTTGSEAAVNQWHLFGVRRTQGSGSGIDLLLNTSSGSVSAVDPGVMDMTQV